MRKDIADKGSPDYIEHTRQAEKRMRNVFLGSVLLCVLVALHLNYLPELPGAISVVVRVSYLPLLLWSLTMAVYAFISLRHIAEDRRLVLENVATTDPKTGVKTLGFLRSMLQREYEKAVETGQPTAVLYVDLQNIDLVNERFGHAVGDIVLKGIAQTIESAMPDKGMVGHVAGDEFVVVLPATKSKKAESIAEWIKQSIKQYNLDLGKDRKVDFLGCSVGVITCPSDAKFDDEIVNIAQMAAKQSRG